MVRAYYLVFVFIGCAAAQDCPNITVMPDFIISGIDGKWYEIESIQMKLGDRCISLTFMTNDNGTIDVTQEYANNTGTNQLLTLEGDITQNYVDEKAKLRIVFPSIDFTSPYWVLDTDYDTFAVTWRCVTGRINAFVLTRERVPDQAVLEKAYAVLDSHGINRSDLKKVDQQNCPTVSASTG